MMARYLWRRKWLAVAYVVLAVIAATMMSLFSLRIAGVFDAAELGDYETVLWLFALMFVWYIFIRLLDFYTESVGLYTINALRRDIKRDLFGGLVGQDISTYSQRNSGEYVAEFTNDVTLLEMKWLVPCKELVSYCITIAASCAAISTIDIRMTAVIFAGFAICLALPMFASGYTSAKMISFTEKFDRYVQYLKDSFAAMATFRNYAVESLVSEKFSTRNAEVEKTKQRAELALVIVNNIVGRVAWIVPLAVVALGLAGVLAGTLSIGSVFSAYLLSGELGEPLQGLCNRISMIRSVRGIERKFLGLMEGGDQEEASAERANGASRGIDICFDRVGLVLDGTPIIQDFTYKFVSGGKYLILGKNGSGKSSVAKLLKRTFASYSGSITLDGKELSSKEGASLATAVSYSNESVALLSDTVFNNVTLYRDASKSDVLDAMRRARLDIPLDRQIGDGGKNISSGERRKLEVARALLGEAEVLILDEVTSTLDVETSYEIEQLALALEETVVMISNAFSGSLLEDYDAILLMDGGRLIASGTHTQLLRECDEYRTIYRLRCGGADVRKWAEDAR